MDSWLVDWLIGAWRFRTYKISKGYSANQYGWI